MDILVAISVLAMIISKFLDCLSTQTRLVDINDEKNSIGRMIMKLFTVKAGIWAVFLLSLLIIALSTWLLYAYYPTTFYKGIFVIAGLFISLVQLAVAHNNYTGRSNFITRKIRSMPLYRGR